MTEGEVEENSLYGRLACRTLLHKVRYTLFTNSLVFGLCHLILRLYKNFTKSEMPRGCKLPWVMCGKLFLNLTLNEIK